MHEPMLYEVAKQEMHRRHEQAAAARFARVARAGRPGWASRFWTKLGAFRRKRIARAHGVSFEPIERAHRS